MKPQVVPWSDRFAFGIEAIDGQHRRLFDYLGGLDRFLRTGEGWLAVHQLLEDLQRWAEVHFAVEEALMEIMAYPEATRHVQCHHEFAATLNMFRERALVENIAVQTSALLHGWLAHHIDVEDRKYAEFFRRRLAAAE